MLAKEAFSRHPRPQAPSVPTHGALILQKAHTRVTPPQHERTGRSLMRVIAAPDVRFRKASPPSSSAAEPARQLEPLAKTPPVSPQPAHLSSSKSIVRRVSPERVCHSAVLPSPPLSYAYPSIETYVRTEDGLPWDHVRRLGTLVQGSSEHVICMNRDESQTITMVKQANRRDGLKEARLLRGLSHPNIVQLHEVFMQDDEVFMELDYCRFTLEEVVNIHIRFEEPHLRLIAHSLFAAIRHISAHRIVHGNIKLKSTRICGRTLLIKLADFDDAESFEDMMPNSDLEQLGLLILQCMDGRNAGNHTDVDRVRQHRALNKVFGLTEPEHWSGAKQLVDFLDDLFSQEKRAETKIAKPHPYIREDIPPVSLLPLLELATLESFVLWKEE